jgi:tetratricopeptide (TPR) repeat protein
MSIEALKEQARRHEQKEEWQKALDQYKKAIAKLDAEDQPDIGLYNRVGDLFVRVGNLDQAVGAYNKAADLYMEAELPNNAIAVCKKVIRNVPERHEAYLRMGQIRAQQGFLPDARTNFLTYAERMQQAGHLDESFRALVEFCDLAPEEVDVRQAVAEQMASHERIPDAVQQLSVAYHTLMQKGDGRASEFEARIRQLDPGADLTAPAVTSLSLGEGEPSFERGSGLADDREIVGTFGDIRTGGAVEEEASAEAEVEAEVGGFEIPSFDIATPEEEEVVVEEEAAPLPTFDLGDEEEEEEPTPLPTFDLGDEEEEAEAAPLPMLDLGEEEPAAGDTLDGVRARIRANPDDQALRQRLVELAYRSGEESVLVEAFMGLGETLQRAGLAARAKAAFLQVLLVDDNHEGAKAALGQAAPISKPVKEVASHEDYVDLGSLLLGDDQEKSTRFVVAYEEPSGDEAADFAKMLSQFKEKVSQNLEADDVRAHSDLGTAYKEMGLLDEAVAEFQQALRASADHLPTYELLGQTFLEMGKPDAAIRSLERALEVNFEIEDELIAIYYYLARAYQEVGNNASAVEFYDRVFSLDINFADVTERLRALR